MLPRRAILEWKRQAPWPEDAQVEQDLVIERALLELFSDPFLRERLAFRGGTALHKLYLKPPARYSEDIDLVQTRPEPIKDTISAIRERLDFLGRPSVKQKANNNTLVYRFESEIPPVVPLRLKIEINCREQFSVLGYRRIDHEIDNTWTTGSSSLIAFAVEELLGTKLRALYQRKKGRDLFDLYQALTHLDVDRDALVGCYREYMARSVDKTPTRKQFLRNMEDKMGDPDFHGDMEALLRPGIEYDAHQAYDSVRAELIERLD
jgi:predicted nucleotidyltransferase component of viral defense system